METEEVLYIKVYKTNVMERPQARSVITKIRKILPDCNVSFDLEDCDKVLRVENSKGPVDDAKIKMLMDSSGFKIEDLP